MIIILFQEKKDNNFLKVRMINDEIKDKVLINEKKKKKELILNYFKDKLQVKIYFRKIY